MIPISPVERIAALYNESSPRSFKEDLEAHLLHGWVFSSPTYFCMGRGVERDASQQDINNPWHLFSKPDTWYVYAFSGDIQWTWKSIPYPLPWIAFERRKGPIKFYPYERIIRRGVKFI
jgi:hypothetical protein